MVVARTVVSHVPLWHSMTSRVPADGNWSNFFGSTWAEERTDWRRAGTDLDEARDRSSPAWKMVPHCYLRVDMDRDRNGNETTFRIRCLRQIRTK